MAVSPAHRELARRIDLDRRTLDLIGIRAAARIGALARTRAFAAFRRGDDPLAAVRDAILGNPRTGSDGIAPIIQAGMVAAHLKGHWRTNLIAAPQMRAMSRYKLAGTAYDDALAFLRKRLELDEDQISDLSDTYQTEALRATVQASRELEDAVGETIETAVREGYGVREGIDALRQTFVREGFEPGREWRLETTFRTQVQLAYGAGRWNSLQDDAIQEILWGYEYNTVGDDRVRETHARMEGTRAPKDDALWGRWWAPCGYNCRCTNLEIWTDERIAEPTEVPDVQPDVGFGFNPGHVFRDMTREAA